MRVFFVADLSHGQATAVWRCRDLLQSQYGIELTNIDPDGRYDLFLVHSTINDWPVYLLEGPTVVLERIDGPQLTANVRKYIADPNLRAVIKNTIYDGINYYNRECWRGHEAVARGRPEPELLPEEKWITPEQYTKLKLGFSFTAYPHYDPIRNLQPFDLSGDRPYVCNFAGTVDYGPEMGWLNAHRLAAVRAIAKIPGPNINLAERAMQFDTYFQSLRQSEFVVSPWGLGEPCYRDFEAVLNGCLVIKPDCRHILTIPQMFYHYPQIARYVCKPDFSDLPEIVARAERVSIGDRIIFAEYVRKANDTLAVAARLARIFKGAVGD